MKEAKCRDTKMEAYRKEMCKLEENFDLFKLHHILRRDNKAVDALVNLASTHGSVPPGVFHNMLQTPSISLEGGTHLGLSSDQSPSSTRSGPMVTQNVSREAMAIEGDG